MIAGQVAILPDVGCTGSRSLGTDFNRHLKLFSGCTLGATPRADRGWPRGHRMHAASVPTKARTGRLQATRASLRMQAFWIEQFCARVSRPLLLIDYLCSGMQPQHGACEGSSRLNKTFAREDRVPFQPLAGRTNSLPVSAHRCARSCEITSLCCLLSPQHARIADLLPLHSPTMPETAAACHGDTAPTPR